MIQVARRDVHRNARRTVARKARRAPSVSDGLLSRQANSSRLQIKGMRTTLRPLAEGFLWTGPTPPFLSPARGGTGRGENLRLFQIEVGDQISQRVHAVVIPIHWFLPLLPVVRWIPNVAVKLLFSAAWLFLLDHPWAVFDAGIAEE